MCVDAPEYASMSVRTCAHMNTWYTRPWPFWLGGGWAPRLRAKTAGRGAARRRPCAWGLLEISSTSERHQRATALRFLEAAGQACGFAWVHASVLPASGPSCRSLLLASSSGRRRRSSVAGGLGDDGPRPTLRLRVVRRGCRRRPPLWPVSRDQRSPETREAQWGRADGPRCGPVWRVWYATAVNL